MKYSRKRDKILEYVKSVKSHPTAETIYTEIRKQNPNISLGTVYRNLDKLVNSKEIIRLKIANAKDRFDGDTFTHYHAICNNCNKVFDIPNLESLQNVDSEVSSILNCEVLSHDLIFNTICSDCKLL